MEEKTYNSLEQLDKNRTNDVKEDFIKQEFGELTPLILRSSWDVEIASQLGGYYLGISTPISERLIMDRSYAGYRGGLRLAEDVFSTILSDYNMY